MYELLKRLKGTSCLLYVLSLQDEDSIFRWQAEALDLLNHTLADCIKELENIEELHNLP